MIPEKQSIILKKAMLPELFAEIIIDSDDCDVNRCTRLNHTDPHVYVPLDRSPRWFLDDNLVNFSISYFTIFAFFFHFISFKS